MRRGRYRRGTVAVWLLALFMLVGLGIGILSGFPGFGAAVGVGAWLGVRGNLRHGREGGNSGPELRPRRGTERDGRSLDRGSPADGFPAGNGNGLVLPSQTLVPTTQTAGYFHCHPATLAAWLAEGLGSDWAVRATPRASLSAALSLVRPQGELTRYLLMPVDGWTVLLHNSPLGTDVGVLPFHAARDLNCRTAWASVVPPSDPRCLEATVFALHDPAAAADPYLCRRSISATDEGKRWLFSQTGDPFPFEDMQPYHRARVRERFTPGMLERYMVELGIPANVVPKTKNALVIERVRETLG